MEVDVVLPCRDEAAALPRLLPRLPAGYRAVVVDNGSRDGTAEVAQELGAIVVRQPVPGYGSAVHAGLLAARAGLVAVLDGDGSLDPAELPALVEAVATGRAELAVGRRRPVTSGAWPLHARAGTALVAARLRRRGVAVHDIAVRVAGRDDVLALAVQDRRSGYPLELLLRAGLAGWRIDERDVSYRPRAAGTRSKVSGSIRGTLVAGHDFRRVLASAALGMTSILVVAKAPVPGLAKTRLIPALGAAGAADVAAAALLDTLDAARSAARRLGGRVVVALTGDLGQAPREGELRRALAGCDVVRQRGSGFAERLVAAHRDAGRCAGGPVVQIGMDTPQVTAALLARCAGDLATADAVLAPAEDGGWWALAVRAPGQAGVLAGVPMSTDRTGELTAAALRAGGMRVAEGPPLRDVDTAEDALAVAALAPHTRFAGAVRALGSLGVLA